MVFELFESLDHPHKDFLLALGEVIVQRKGVKRLEEQVDEFAIFLLHLIDEELLELLILRRRYRMWLIWLDSTLRYGQAHIRLGLWVKEHFGDVASLFTRDRQGLTAVDLDDAVIETSCLLVRVASIYIIFIHDTKFFSLN